MMAMVNKMFPETGIFISVRYSFNLLFVLQKGRLEPSVHNPSGWLVGKFEGLT